MTADTDDFGPVLKAARESKGLSQRELSARARLPQAHISKIENGAVDLRVSSLVALARELDLELTLVPRKTLGAVQSIIRASEPPPAPYPAAPRELNVIQRLLSRAALQAHAPRELAQLHRLLRDIRRVPLTGPQRNELKRITADLQKLQERVGGDDLQETRVDGAEELRLLRDALARMQTLRNNVPKEAGRPRPAGARPAYTLDDEDDV